MLLSILTLIDVEKCVDICRAHITKKKHEWYGLAASLFIVMMLLLNHFFFIFDTLTKLGTLCPLFVVVAYYILPFIYIFIDYLWL